VTTKRPNDQVSRTVQFSTMDNR